MESPELDFVLVSERDTTGSDQSGLQPLSAEEQLKIRTWLRPTNYSADSSEYHRHLSSHVSGTTEWTQKPQYRQWIASEDQGAFWVKAIAGAGKSVAAAYLAYELQKVKHVPVLYFFFRQIIESNRTPFSLLRDWMSQLLEFSPCLQWRLKEYLEPARSLGSVAFDELWQHFEDAVCNLRRVYCFADALDEMSGGNDWFIERLAKLGQLKPTSVKVLMTSRPLPQIESLLRSESIVKIALGKTLVDKDIAVYIQHRLRRSVLPKDVWQDAQDDLVTRSQGSFLYTKLTMDDLLNSTRHDLSDAASVREALDGMPNGLAEKYTSMLHDHSARSGVPQSLQLIILRWVTHSCRPLRLLEIAAMVDSLPEKDGLKYSSQGDHPRRNTKSIIRGACGPLIEILEDKTVGVIHHSFTEFLTDSNRNPCADSALSFPIINSKETHLDLALTCMNYLTSDWADHAVFENSDQWSLESGSAKNHTETYVRYPFLKYASVYATYHSSQFGASSDDLFRSLDSLFLTKAKTFALWLQVKKELDFNSKFPCSPTSSALHVAASEGLAHYVEHLIHLGQDVMVKDENSRTPMHCAATSGSTSVIEVLLKHGADADPDDCAGMKPLHLAATRNCADVVTTLLNAGVDPLTPKTREDPGRWCGNAPSSTGDTPVEYAFTYGHFEASLAFVPFLDSDAVCKALNWSTEAGKADIVLAVLDLVKVDINKIMRGKTLLFLAAYQHEPRLVRKLLDLGADSSILSNSVFDQSAVREISDDDEYCSTPLHALAIRKPYATVDRKLINDVLRLLLASGCDIAAADAVGRTPLHLAVTNRHGYYDGSSCIALALLEHGANPSAVTKQGFEPLHVAMSNSEIVHALCKSGANVNAVNSQDGKTALHYAVEDLRQDKFLALLECKADCNVQDKSGNTPLHLAIATNFHRNLLVKRLLENGADPNVRNKEGKTPLLSLGADRFAKTDEFKELIAMLVSAGADLELPNQCGRTLFMEFMSCHSVDPSAEITVFQDAGCKINARDYEGRNTLHLALAAKAEDESLLRELMRAGVDHRAVDFAGNTLLHHFARHRTFSRTGSPKTGIVFKILLELGFTIDQRNHLGQTALYIAAARARAFLGANLGLLDILTDSQCRVNVNIADHLGVHPIHLGAINGEPHIRWLIDRGANPFAVTNDGQSALHLAARARQCNVVGVLAELFLSRSSSDFIDHADKRGRTALHYACRSGRIESVRILLDSGANINVVDTKKLSPLDACAEFSKYNFLGSCAENGGFVDAADIMRDHDHCIAPTRTNNGRFYGYHEFDDIDSVGIRYIARLLIAHNADISNEPHPDPLWSGHFTQFGNFHLDNARDAGCAVLLEELSRGIEKVEQVMVTDASGDCPGRRQTTPFKLYLERYYCLRSKHSWELLDAIIEPGEPNSEIFHTLLQHEDEKGLEKFIELNTDLLAPNSSWPDLPLTALARHGYADILKKVYLTRSSISSPRQVASDGIGDQESQDANRLLLIACQRELPNLEVIKVLVECGNLNVNFAEEGDGYRMRETVLHKLARSSHWWQIKAIEYLIQKGASVDFQSSEGMTPLHVAVEHGSRTAVEVLLQNGANPNVLAENNESCLNRLSLNRPHLSSIAHLLLDHGADPALGSRPFLIDAIEAVDLDIVTRLLGLHVDPNKLYKWPIKYGEDKEDRPIHLAGSEKFDTKESRPKMIPIIEALLRGGGQPFTISEDGVPVLHDICERGGIVEPFFNIPGIDLETRDCHGRTLFLAACSHRRRPPYDADREAGKCKENRPTAAQELAARGVNIAAVDNSKKTALHHLLADYGVSFYPPPWLIGQNFDLLTSHLSTPTLIAHQDNDGMTPLLHAANVGAFNFLSTLLSKGADPHVTDHVGNSALHYSAKRLDSAENSFRPIQAILALGAAINARNDLGETPLFLYLRKKSACVGTLKLFADAGADLFSRNQQGQGLLHVVAARKVSDCWYQLAAEKGEDLRMDMFEWLVGKGLDVSWEDEEERTALDLAGAAGNEGILGLFRRKE